MLFFVFEGIPLLPAPFPPLQHNVDYLIDFATVGEVPSLQDFGKLLVSTLILSTKRETEDGKIELWPSPPPLLCASYHA